MSGSISSLINYCEQACNSAKVGYSQDYRSTGAKNYTSSGWNVTSYFDCSSLMGWISYKAGFVANNLNPDTDFIYKNWQNYGFTKYELVSGGSWLVSDSFQIKKGDIIVNVTHQDRWAGNNSSTYSGHTYIALTDGTVGGGFKTGEAYGSNNVAWANQVGYYYRRKTSGGSYMKITSRSYCRLFRPNDSGGGSSGSVTYSWIQKPNYSGSTVTGGSGLTDDQIKNNAICAYKRLKSKGWSDNSIIGVLGNAYYESSINPDCWNYNTGGSSACGMKNTDGGYGIFQFTPATKYTKSSYCPSDYKTNATANGNGQIDLLDTGTVWTTSGMASQWNSANSKGWSWSQFKTQSELSAEDSAEFFLRWYEMWNGKINNEASRIGRRNYATTIKNWIGDTDWTEDTGHVSDNDTGEDTGKAHDKQSLALYFIMKRNNKFY